MASENPMERLRAELKTRRRELQTSHQRRAAATQIAREYKVHEDFVLGFIEDVIGVARAPTEEEIARSERVTHREMPKADEKD